MKTAMNHSIAKVGMRGLARCLMVLVLLTSVLPMTSRARATSAMPTNPIVMSSQIDITGPPGSQQFGTTITALPNGNIVVTDPFYSTEGPTPIANAGAVYLYNGATGALISMLTGSTAGDRVGFLGVQVLSNGNYVVRSPFWNNGAASSAGAVTWCSAATGVHGAVSAANSLVGTTAFDLVSVGGVRALSDDNYVVISQNWHNGAIDVAGAVSLDKASSVVGPVSARNSVLGTAPGRGFNMISAYDNVNRQLIVGRPDSNIVTLFRVRVFDTCLQDDGNPNTSVAFNTQTGDYVFCAGGAQYSGTGTITRRGSMITLQHTANDRRLTVTLDTAVNRATGSMQKLGVGTVSLTDRDTRNDNCPCAAP